MPGNVAPQAVHSMALGLPGTTLNAPTRYVRRGASENGGPLASSAITLPVAPQEGHSTLKLSRWLVDIRATVNSQCRETPTLLGTARGPGERLQPALQIPKLGRRSRAIALTHLDCFGVVATLELVCSADAAVTGQEGQS